MDSLFRQTRFSSAEKQEKKEEPGSSNGRRIPPQKTQSFKDKRQEPKRFQKQVSWKMDQDYDSSSGDEREVAITAAAYAISSLEEPGIPNQKKTDEERGTSIVPIKSKKEESTISISEHGEIMQSSDNPDTETDTKKQQSGSFKRSSSSFKSETGTSSPDLPSSTIKPARTPSFTQSSGSFKRGNSKPKPDVPSMVSQPRESKTQSSTRAGMGKSQAYIWEEAELARIKERYEAQKSTILTWEGKKAAKSKRQYEKAERELERKRAKALAKYRRNIQNINQIVGGAKAKADEKKKNDELKVREKANTIRKTGKVPNTCSCF